MPDYKLQKYRWIFYQIVVRKVHDSAKKSMLQSERVTSICPVKLSDSDNSDLEAATLLAGVRTYL